MQLVRQLRQSSRQFLIAGLIALAVGLIFIVDDWRQGRLPTNSFGVVLLIGLVVWAGFYFYQTKINWRVIRQRLLNADLVARTPETPYKPVPIWMQVGLWALWALIMFGFAFSLNGAFALFFASFLLAYGLANPVIAKSIEQLEAGRVVFYTTRDQGSRPKVVRVHATDDEDGEE